MLCSQVDVIESSVLCQYEHQLSSIFTETLRGIVLELLSDMNKDSEQNPFYNNAKKT